MKLALAEMVNLGVAAAGVLPAIQSMLAVRFVPAARISGRVGPLCSKEESARAQPTLPEIAAMFALVHSSP